MITENILSNYGIEDPENDKNIEMNFEMKDSKLMNENKISQIENLSQKVDSISEKIQNLNIDSNSFSQSNDNISIFTKENLNEKYNQLESKKHLLKYGENIYTYNRLLSVKNSIPENFLFKHKLTPYARMKMVDWMIEVLKFYNCSNETFFLSVSIMDQFLYKTNSIIKNQNIHLIGISCMYIANKFEEIYPIPLKHFVYKIGHEKFNDNLIKSQTMRILKVISFENLVITSVYEFIKLYFFDLYVNNTINLIGNDSLIIYHKIEETAIYFAKISLHFINLYCLNDKEKAICCISCAIQLFFEKNQLDLNNERKKFYQDWETFILNNNHIFHFNQRKNELYKSFFDYHNLSSINRNLEKLEPLSYIQY